MKIVLAACLAFAVVWGQGRSEKADELEKAELLDAANRAQQYPKPKVRSSEQDFCDVICEEADEQEMEACVLWCELELDHAVKQRESSGNYKRGFRIRWPAPRIRVPAPDIRFRK
ncbi:uncharacterized protein LOC127857078 [Dreissena polymorpha]|uniref:Uncharacterized protein n=1 Tax=Dreissena polymorpha TaxID=45954 RepID=A0A9D4BN48_DREPO|nr:uncharacterized protein LOC127857078 [Dreissena polymorpha]KAH3710041.1 hypothetical protein DPMN_069507 [Dreissena polymorpha]